MVSRNRWNLIHDGPEISPEATPSRSKIEPESTRDRPEATWDHPGGAQAEKTQKLSFWTKLGAKMWHSLEAILNGFIIWNEQKKGLEV